MEYKLFENNEATLKEAKVHLRENFIKGTFCPCCGQFVKEYHRRITGSSAMGLILMYKFFIAEQLDIGDEININALHSMYKADYKTYLYFSGDFAKLKYWGLLDLLDGVRDDGSKRVGKYTLTEKGIAFVNKQLTVPKKIRLFDNKFLGFVDEEDKVDITYCLGKNFNYRELMQTYD